MVIAGSPFTMAGCSNVSQTQMSGAGPRDKSFRLSGRRHFSLCLMVFFSVQVETLSTFSFSLPERYPLEGFSLHLPRFRLRPPVPGFWWFVGSSATRVLWALVAPEPPECTGVRPRNAGRSSLSS